MENKIIEVDGLDGIRAAIYNSELQFLNCLFLINSGTLLYIMGFYSHDRGISFLYNYGLLTLMIFLISIFLITLAILRNANFLEYRFRETESALMGLNYKKENLLRKILTIGSFFSWIIGVIYVYCKII